MAIIFGGHENGLLNSSLTLLNRNDQTANGRSGHGEQVYVNASNGNLVIAHQDIFLPSLGDDYALVRTYNSRGEIGPCGDDGWNYSTSVRLDEHCSWGPHGMEKYLEVRYGDGSKYDYRLDADTGLYVSTDGAGAFETIEVLEPSSSPFGFFPWPEDNEPKYILTRADQTRLSFDRNGRLIKLEDTNGVQIDYVYHCDRLVQVLDDQGHVLNYEYNWFGQLCKVTDESEGVLVEYRYGCGGKLSEVIDRFGHSTRYFYTWDGLLERIELPDEQVVDGDVETYSSRELRFEYGTFSCGGPNNRLLTKLIDAEGNATTFDYDFDYSFNFWNGNVFEGGTTTVVDALGNNRAYSNDTEYVDWRLANGYYERYCPFLEWCDPNFKAQVDAIKKAHALIYNHRADGYITEVIDQQGYHTGYAYDDQDNLISITDRNGWGATHSDSAYYRQLRAELGVVDAGGSGKLAADLTEQEIADLTEAFTRHFAYDDRGNLTHRIDNADNETTLTYTEFNKPAATTSAVGRALVTSNDQQYQDKRVELGYAALVEDLSAADTQALLDLHTTYFEYDASQNLIERRDAGGDITRFEYDQFGNLIRRTVFLDANDLDDPAKQQVTAYAYDGYGNNIGSTDAEGHQTHSEYDHFGNLLRFTDANGGVTRYTYDKDNRLLTITDPEGHTTINAYDAVGNRIAITDAGGHTITRVYDRSNRLIATIDPSETDPAGDRTTSFEYDVVGNNTAVVDAEGRRTEYAFNTRRELVEVLTAEVDDEAGNPTRYSSTMAYDGEGNRIRTTNNRGFTTEILYTQNNLVRQQTDPNGHITRIEYDADNSRVRIIAGVQLPEAKRQILRFSYDEENQLTTRTDAQGNVTTYAYDAPGNRIAATDANGHTTEFEYDGNNRLVREMMPEVADPATGHAVRYTIEHRYDGNGNEIETIDANGHSTRFTFDRDDLLTMVEDANGIKTVFAYDSRHNRTAVMIGVEAGADGDGHITVTNADPARTTRYVYDAFNQLIARTDGVGNALAESDAALYQQQRQQLGYAALVADLTAADQQALRELYTRHFAYDKAGNRLSEVDHLDRTTTYHYDGLNRLTSTTDAGGGTTAFAYDGNGNRVWRTDPLGRTTTFGYDSMDRLTDSTDPMGTVTHRTYDDFGNLLTETRAFETDQARTSTFEYDLNNRLIARLDPEGHRQRFEYDAVGNRIRVVDGRGNATRYVYNALNRNVQIIDPLSFETRLEYDGAGNRIGLIDARGGITRLDYDPGNRLISTTDAEGRVTTFAYDVRGNRIEQRTAAGTAEEAVTRYEYDAENNLRRVIDAEGGITENNYDRVYNRIETIDANGHATISEFDALNRVVRLTDAEGQETQFSYDAVGNRLTRTDALGRVTEFVYDANDQVIRRIAADGVETHYAYDLVGNRTTITRAANTADAAVDTFVYNLDDRLIEQIDAEGHSTTYAYDENHNRTHVTDANGHTTVYTYDANDRVTRIQDPEGHVVQYAYDGNGNRIQVVDGRGSVSTTYYNADNEVALSVDAEGFATGFVYDNNGNVVSRTLYMQALDLPLDPAVVPVPAAGADDQTTRFEYDRLNRVVRRVDAEGYGTEYTYDAVGNRLQTRLSRDLAGTDVAVTHSYYDDVNRETARVTAEGYLTRLTYDAVGNRVSRTVFDQPVTPPAGGDPAPVAGDIGRTHAMAYDAVNRLVRETSPLGVHTDYEYDLRGNRTAAIEAAGTTDARRTEFAYDSADRLADTTDVLGHVTHRVHDAAGNVVEQHDAYGTDDVRVTTFEYDGNNRLISRTNALGIVTQSTYDANGNLMNRTEAAGLPEARTETFEYDANNRLIARTNGEGQRTESAYDGAGNRTQLILAPGTGVEQVNTFAFDRDNRLIAGTDGEGTRTEYRYDGAGNKIETIQAAGIAAQERHSYYQYDLDNRLTQITDPMGGITHYTYDVLGNQTQIVNANGGVQTNTFDAVGRMLTSLSAGDILTVNTYDLRGNITSTTQSSGDGKDSRTTTYGYDLLDRQVGVTDPQGFSTTIAYDPFGNQVTITHGQYLLQPGDDGYDADKAAAAFVQSNSFVYDRADRMLSMEDALGNITAYTYDAVGNRTSMTEASNSAPRTTAYAYDRAGRLVQTTTPEGGIVQKTYDAAGNLSRERLLQSDDGTTRVWITHRFEYDANGRLAAEVDDYDVRTEFEYDAMGNRTTVRMAAGSADERTTGTEYDLNNRVSAEIDGEGHRTEYAYDAMGNRIKATDALGRTARYYFDSANNLVTILDAEGYINTFGYDAAGNRTAEIIHMTPYTGSADDFTAPTATPSPLDRSSSSDYDGNGRIVRRTEADGSETLYTYDGAGNLKSEVQFTNTDAPRELTYEYDLNNRLIHFTDADGTVTTFGYDGANNKISETITSTTDANAVRQTTYQYDLNNRRISQTFDPDGLNLVQTTAYDKLGNAIARTDANGHTTRAEYDLNNRMVRTIDALGNVTRIDYDDVGNQIAVTDANLHKTEYIYDANNRLIREITPEVYVYTTDEGGVSKRLVITHVYDAVGNEVQTTDAAGFVTTRYYDNNNRLAFEINGDNVLRGYGYNGAGDRVSETLYMTRVPSDAHDPDARPVPPAGESRTTTTEYDHAGRATRTIYPAIEVTALSGTLTDDPAATVSTVQPEERNVYDAFGNLVESFDKQGNRTVCYYDIKDRMTARVDPEGYLTEYDYDAQDNMTEQRIYTAALDPATIDAAVRPAAPAGEVYRTSRAYDAASRLIEEHSPEIDVYNPDTKESLRESVRTRYRYDGVGNLVERTLAADSDEEVTEYYKYDNMDRQRMVIDSNKVVNYFEYDANGNQTLARRYYNALTGLSDMQLRYLYWADIYVGISPDAQDQEWTSAYDALNRRTEKSDLVMDRFSGVPIHLTKQFDYDANGNLSRSIDEDSYEQKLKYDANGNIVLQLNHDDTGARLEYDAAGNRTVVTNQLAHLTGEGGFYTEMRYNAVNALIATHDQQGRWIEYGVDANGNALVTENHGIYDDGDSIITYAAFDRLNRQVAQFDAAVEVYGQAGLHRPVTRFEYDVNNNVVREIGPQTVTARTWSAMGMLTSETLAPGTDLERITAYGYNRRGCNTAEIIGDEHGDPEDKRVTLRFYDLAGNLKREVREDTADAQNSLETIHDYDSFSRRIKTTDGLGYYQTMAYDRRDRLISMTDKEGNALATSNQQQYQDKRVALGYAALAEELTEGQQQELRDRQTTEYGYDGRNNHTYTRDANGHEFYTDYDENGRLYRQYHLPRQWPPPLPDEDPLIFDMTYTYDDFGNRIKEVSAEGRETLNGYQSFGRLDHSTNADERKTEYTYDDQGNVIYEFAEAMSINSATNPEDHPVRDKSIIKEYDDLGRLVLIDDQGTDMMTEYAYDIAGNRKWEAITPTIPEPPDQSFRYHDRDITYDYDELGQMVRWSDSVTGTHMNYDYNVFGDVVLRNTDPGYDPDDKFDADSEQFYHVYNAYAYDNIGRLHRFDRRGLAGQVIVLEATTYLYDAAGNLNSKWKLWESSPTYYDYDANGRVIESYELYDVDFQEDPYKSRVGSWKYDNVGNVRRYASYHYEEDYVQEENPEFRDYDEMNRLIWVYSIDRTTLDDIWQLTEYTRDKDGKVVTTAIIQEDSVSTYTHVLSGSGIETEIKAIVKDENGEEIGKGWTTCVFDSNHRLWKTQRGKSGDQTEKEQLIWRYNNEGQIIARRHLTGNEDDDTWQRLFKYHRYDAAPDYRTFYLYANGNPVGEVNEAEGVPSVTVLDTDRYERDPYSLTPIIDETNPEGPVQIYTARAGDTLQSIAAEIYGNESLWFVIAEANGLEMGAPIPEGRVLQIPNTVKSGRITAQTHALYNEGEIIGSSLPNIRSIPVPASGGGGGCGSFLITIIVVVVAIVVAVVTYGAASALSAIMIGAATATGVAATAITVATFAVVGAAVAAAGSVVQQGLFMALGYQEEFNWDDVGSAAVAGALSGAAQGVAEAVRIGQIVGDAARYANVAARALKVASVASTQLMQDGQITSWTSLAAAALGPVSSGSEKGAVEIFPAIGGETGAAVVSYVTPWAKMAETYVRNDELTATDWATAVGSTMTTAIDRNNLGRSADGNMALRMAGNMMVGGALSSVDREAGQTYLMESVGQEVGQYIGQRAGSALNKMFADFQYQRALEGAMPDSYGDWDEGSLLAPPTSSDHLEAVPDDAYDMDWGGGAGAMPENFLGPYQVQSGDTLWDIAERQLGAGATDAEILEQTQLLMQENPGVDPRALQIGQTLNLIEPGAGVVGDAARQAYARSDAELREYLAAQSPAEQAFGGYPDELISPQQQEDWRDIVPNELMASHPQGTDNRFGPSIDVTRCHWEDLEGQASNTELADYLDRFGDYASQAIEFGKEAWNRSIPDARMIGLSHNAGLLGTWSAGVEMVINSESGEVSFFGYHGPEIGWTGTGVGAKAGYIYNLKQNEDYSGRFFSVNAEVPFIPVVGVSGFATRLNDNDYIDLSSGSNTVDLLKNTFDPRAIINELDFYEGAYGYAATIGASVTDLAGIGTYSVSDTHYSRPKFTIPNLGYFLDPVGAIKNKLDFD